ncbi:type II toxin-antitoxin system MqsA family antitoxin [Oxalobacteraceae bacterium A2-2]
MKNCPVCGAPFPEYATRNLPYTYRGKTTIIPAVSGYHCAHCGEVTLDRAAADRYSELIGEFERRVNKDPVEPTHIEK